MRLAMTDFHLDWGGQAYQALLLGQALAARGHAVTIFAPPQSVLAERAAAAGLDVCRDCRFVRGFRPRAWRADWCAFRRAAAGRGLELVHAHGSQDNWLAALARLAGGPRYVLVRTKHNSYAVRGHPFNRWLYGRADRRVIAVAEPIRQELLRAGVAQPERVTTIHAGLPDAVLADVPPGAAGAVRAELGLPAEAKLIGLVGRLEPDKGQEILLQALARLRRERTDVHAVLVGTGGDYDRLLRVRAELGLESAAHFTLFRQDVARLTAAFSVAVLAATGCDASSTVLKEAMLLGVPVVGTDVGGTREILADGACGPVVGPGDAAALAAALGRVLDAAGTPALAAQIERARGRVRAEYVMSAVAARTEALYRECLE